MKKKVLKIKNLVKAETQKVQKKRPFLEKLVFSYEQKERGLFKAKIKAKTNKKTIVLSEENYCPEATIRKAFENLTKVLRKKKFRKSPRLSFHLKEAV